MRGPGIPLTDERATAESGEMDDEQFAFIMAMDRYKRENRRKYVTMTETLAIFKALGYRRLEFPDNVVTAEAEKPRLDYWSKARIGGQPAMLQNDGWTVRDRPYRKLSNDRRDAYDGPPILRVRGKAKSRGGDR